MTLPVLILVAIVIPLVVMGAIWFLAKTTMWFGLHPHVAAVATIAFGLIYIGVGFEQWSETHHWSDLLFSAMGLFAIGNGLYRWSHPAPVSFE